MPNGMLFQLEIVAEKNETLNESQFAWRCYMEENDIHALHQSAYREGITVLRLPYSESTMTFPVPYHPIEK